MDLTKETVDRLLQVGGELLPPQTIQIAGRMYSTKDLKRITEPMPDALKLDTLTGIVDYLKANPDKITDTFIHVVSAAMVAVHGPMVGPFLQRPCYLLSEATKGTSFAFGRYCDLESFIIAIQSQFVQDETTAAMLAVLGNVKDENVTNFTDDGMTQSVMARKGIAMREQVPVPNPVTLRPYRTFMEIPQPVSSYTVRVKAAKEAPPECALFQADGGMWQVEAMQSIKDFLAAELPGVVILA